MFDLWGAAVPGFAGGAALGVARLLGSLASVNNAETDAPKYWQLVWANSLHALLLGAIGFAVAGYVTGMAAAFLAGIGGVLFIASAAGSLVDLAPLKGAHNATSSSE